MSNTERRLLRIRIEDLKKWRKDIGYEFERYSMFYTIKWFINQMNQIDKRIEILEKELYQPK